MAPGPLTKAFNHFYLVCYADLTNFQLISFFVLAFQNMKNVGESLEKPEENWRDKNEPNSIKNSKDPPYEEQGPLPVDYIRSVTTCEEEYVRRPMNAFMVWSRSERRKLALKYPKFIAKNILNIHIDLEGKNTEAANSSSGVVSSSVNPNNISCYPLQNNDIFDSTYSNGNYNNYGYYYDQYANSNYLTGSESQNSINFLQNNYNRMDNKMQNYFQSYQPNNGYSTPYSDSFKLLAPYSIQDSMQTAFPCNAYFTNLPYMNNPTSSTENFERNAPFNYGSINSIFPEISNTTNIIPQSEPNHVNNHDNPSLNIFAPATSSEPQPPISP
ncbi:LOW QUALITY PROTEIN: hypothetical protein MXB_1722 [Myxobolus squamalis]|nr:LOW QUALITY PROTEIN: hypothetical protein MXB_1722 [Myxobolus squamalis]